jgi:hypothetical protein
MKQFYMVPKTTIDGVMGPDELLPGQSRRSLLSGCNGSFLYTGTDDAPADDPTNSDDDEWMYFIVTEFINQEAMFAFHQCQGVARLFDVSTQADIPLSSLYTDPQYAYKNFTQQYFTLMQQLCVSVGAGPLNPTNTLRDFIGMVQAAYPSLGLPLNYY